MFSEGRLKVDGMSWDARLGWAPAEGGSKLANGDWMACGGGASRLRLVQTQPCRQWTIPFGCAGVAVSQYCEMSRDHWMGWEEAAFEAGDCVGFKTEALQMYLTAFECIDQLGILMPTFFSPCSPEAL